MNLRQLQYISAVAKNGLNVSATAESLFTSQPGVSKQIRQLEDELGVQIFERSGRQLTRITPAGEAIIEFAERALVEVDTLRVAAQEHRDPHVGKISLAMTHTVALYLFPPVIERFVERFPRVTIELHTGSPSQIAEMVNSGIAQFGIATEVMAHFEDLVAVPCYRWRRAVIVPVGHPLTGVEPLTLEAIAEYPLSTYVFGFDRGAPLDEAFRKRGLTPDVHFTATDADVVKTYVRRGLGVGIVAALAYDAEADPDLACLEATHLFEISTARLVFRRGTFFRRFMFEFITEFAPHLTEDSMRMALGLRGKTNLDPVFADTELPAY